MTQPSGMKLDYVEVREVEFSKYKSGSHRSQKDSGNCRALRRRAIFSGYHGATDA